MDFFEVFEKDVLPVIEAGRAVEEKEEGEIFDLEETEGSGPEFSESMLEALAEKLKAKISVEGA